MAVHALRVKVGDRGFFRILKAWTSRRGGGHGTIPQFIRLAERISGQQLDDLFQIWLFTGSKPLLEGAAAASASQAKATTASRSAGVRAQLREAAGLRR
jgi:aminopeptidase N